MNILLCCAGGMSTSLLVEKMKEAAKNMSVECNIWAIGEADINNHIDKADIVLIGPQLRYKLKVIREIAKDKDIAVETISPIHYGMIDGKGVLEFALQFKK